MIDSPWARIGIALGVLLFASPVLAQRIGGDVAMGEEKADACISCHGEHGTSDNAQFPKIGGQYADYLLHTLQAYKSGERENPVMEGQVENLSAQDMADLAAFYASQDSALGHIER